MSYIMSNKKIIIFLLQLTSRKEPIALITSHVYYSSSTMLKKVGQDTMIQVQLHIRQSQKIQL